MGFNKNGSKNVLDGMSHLQKLNAIAKLAQHAHNTLKPAEADQDGAPEEQQSGMSDESPLENIDKAKSPGQNDQSVPQAKSPKQAAAIKSRKK